MSLGGFLDSSGGSGYGFPKYMLPSAGLSLGLANADALMGALAGEAGAAGGDAAGSNREDSGSDRLDAGSGDDADQDANRPAKKKKYHRHTPQQIQELEGLFKDCPHPDEKQRLELSRRLNLDSRQVKFWFQNRRTQMKTQLERHENALLRQENDRLKAENMCIRDAMRNAVCPACGGPAVLGEASLDEQHLRLENARLREELQRVYALAGKFLGRPFPPEADSAALGPVPAAGAADRALERSVCLELALGAMDELVKLVQAGEPLWARDLDVSTKESLNRDEYARVFQRPKPTGLVTEATRDFETVMINGLTLVEILMDPVRWTEMFSCIVARSSTVEVLSQGVAGSRNGALQIMRAELQVLSPLVPIRETTFVRFCKQLAEGVWAVADVSADGIPTAARGGGWNGSMSCRRLPSGCVVQDMANGYSKVTWVEHTEYDETAVHQLYRPLLRAGLGLGASRWLATLQRQCECLAIIMSNSAPARDHTAAVSPAGRRSMLKLARRMTGSFCAGVCPSTVHKWDKLAVGSAEDPDIRVMTRKSMDDPGEPPGIVLSTATSVWLPVPPHRVFDFLRNEGLRSEWDILSNGGPMQEMAHITKGPDTGNCVSLLRASAAGANQTSMLILQETCTDASGSLVVYAPVDIPAMHVVMNGGDSTCVALLPSGFAIFPDTRQLPPDQTAHSSPAAVSGTLLTVAFQILVNSLPNAKLSVESVETVNNLIACTVQKIRASLQCDA